MGDRHTDLRIVQKEAKALEILTYTQNVDREREDGISDRNTQGLPVSFSDSTYLVDGRRKSQGVFRKGHSGKTF